MRAEIDKADSFAGLPRGTAKPLQILAAFEQALPYLALPALTQRLVGFLVRCTEPQDWEEGSHPIAWPSATRLQRPAWGFAAARENADPPIVRSGIFVMRDHPQGKRYGRRDAQGRIIDACGFDVSRLAQRREEIVRIAAAAKIERDRMRELKRRKTSARRAIAQAVEELGRQNHDSEALAYVKRRNSCRSAAHAPARMNWRSR
jgi:replication initiation protein RepC